MGNLCPNAAQRSSSTSFSELVNSRTTLFKQEEYKNNGKTQVTYRIPALIYISDNQTFFAFAEKRKTSNDTDAEVLVMRKGTWKDGTVQWCCGHQVLSFACLPNHRCMNPCPVYEKTSKTLFLFYICVPNGVSEQDQIREGKNQARLCYVSSKDSGKTWSLITDLTTDVIGDQVKDCATFAVGPGHGIQMQSGRLIIPAYVYHRNSHTPYAFAFYSDDKGSTWKVGKQIKSESSECQMAEIINKHGDSALYCNARSSSGFRTEAISKNSGKDFDPLFPKKLIETGKGCEGSVLRVLSPNNGTWLLYSHPTDPKKRMSLGAYVNKTPMDASKWKYTLPIYKGPSGYSDLAQCGDEEQFACLMECGVKREIEKIAFVLFKLPDSC